jgi:hypothetical protein
LNKPYKIANQGTKNPFEIEKAKRFAGIGHLQSVFA